MLRTLAIAVFFAMTSAASALEDTPQNREEQVKRYLTNVPPKSVFDDMTSKVANSIPAEQREMFTTAMSKNLDIGALTDAMHVAMVKTFTADELSALADFYGSPVGKSAMGKMGDYMAELMPVLGHQMDKAMRATQSEMTNQPKN